MKLCLPQAPLNRLIWGKYPLMPDESIAAKKTLIGGGFSDTISYPLTINGTSQNGNAFTIQKHRDYTPLEWVISTKTLEQAAALFFG